LFALARGLFGGCLGRLGCLGSGFTCLSAGLSLKACCIRKSKYHEGSSENQFPHCISPWQKKTNAMGQVSMICRDDALEMPLVAQNQRLLRVSLGIFATFGPRRMPIKQTIKASPFMSGLVAINAFYSPGMLVGARRGLGHIRQPAVLALKENRIAHSPPGQPLRAGQSTTALENRR
jgi:hypothetical protein